MVTSGRKIDLGLADFAMPEMTGAELAKAIHATCPSLPVIIVTGYSNHGSLKEFGAARILRKPYTESGLIEEIKAALG
jgi:CheY-like chemotaxis protein